MGMLGLPSTACAAGTLRRTDRPVALKRLQRKRTALRGGQSPQASRVQWGIRFTWKGPLAEPLPRQGLGGANVRAFKNKKIFYHILNNSAKGSLV